MLYTLCGARQVTWKTILPGSPEDLCPAPLDSEGEGGAINTDVLPEFLIREVLFHCVRNI